ncbi:hypothetical protein [Sulfurovum sp.]|uniref:hypothetical protein n=1 Tax=Sulfurovum sp. TaxID=1969726 RepID=UPI0025E17D7D|nr:hypothetical protein [Sulfurovum sp.]
MSFGDYVYIVAVILFAYMTFVIIRNNFRSKFDAQERRKDLADEYEEDYIVDKQPESKED